MLKNVEVTKSAGIDQISGKFLKNGVWIEFWKKLLVSCAIFPWHYEVFPMIAKLQRWSPYLKKGSKTDPWNYRSMSLLLLLSKVFERVVLNQTEEFFSLN